jgi:hypothetical protein
VERIRYPETSVKDYHSKLRNIAEKRRFHQMALGYKNTHQSHQSAAAAVAAAAVAVAAAAVVVVVVVVLLLLLLQLGTNVDENIY